MNRFRYLCASAVLSLLLSGCSTLRMVSPRRIPKPWRPNQILEFATLYAQNCAGCHGAQGRGGAAIALADPVYLAIVDEASMRKVIANGIHGTSMPAFAQSAGGMLTDKQIDVITSGIFSRWGRKGILDGSNPPSYAAKTAGNAAEWRTRLRNLLRILPRPRRSGRAQGQRHHQRFIPGSCQRPGTAHDRHRWPAGIGRAGLAWKRSGKTDDGPGDHGCRCLARVTPRARIPGSLIPLRITRSTRSPRYVD